MLDRRIEFQLATTTQDATGQPIPAWSTVFSAWAKVRGMEGREDASGHRVIATRRREFTVRRGHVRASVANLTPRNEGGTIVPVTLEELRIRYDDSTWNIHSADGDRDDRAEMVIVASEAA